VFRSDPIGQRIEDLTHRQFLTAAGLFEGGLLVAAFAGGWLTGVNPTASLAWGSTDVLLGLLASIPMLLMLAVSMLSRSSGMDQIRRFLRDTVGAYLVHCTWLDLLLLAVLAGVCEEVFFRGFLYSWIQLWNPVLAVMLSNLLFAAAHAVTPLYALLAGFLGLYLTALISIDATPNLLIPIIAHAFYDLIAFRVVIHDYRRHTAKMHDTHDSETDV
jgi:membrane protease YdiL (CAAX protease family)